jgi:methylase of polypeptide subunit release factors
MRHVSPCALLEQEAGLFSLLARLRDAGYSFVTPTPATHARVNRRPEAEQARTISDIFGWSRPFAQGMLSAAWHDELSRALLVVPQDKLWLSRVRVSTLAGHYFAHGAFPTRDADAVFFGPDTYRFARILELLLAARKGPVSRAIDIGCGSGAGAVLIAMHYPEADVLMTDINDRALALAKVNAAFAGARRARAVKSDLFDSIAEDRFDLIIANPPYLVDKLRRAYRHGGGSLGAELSARIAAASIDRLAPGGTLLLYTGVAIVQGRDPLLAECEDLLRGKLRWTYDELDPDVFGEELEAPPYDNVDRIAVVALTATKGD